MWKKYLTLLLQLAPSIVTGVESVCKEAPGATKQKLAADSLHLAASTVMGVDPKDSELVTLSETVGNLVIDATVKDKNNSGEFTHKQPAAPSP